MSLLEDSPQRIVINVEDVDEKPRFVNEPVPYLAVVKPETFIGFVVFTFHAVDEQGDLLEDPDGVGYQQIASGDGKMNAPTLSSSSVHTFGN